MHPLDLILKKRNGGELTGDEIRAFVRDVVQSSTDPGAGTISDAQTAALLMAIFQRGLSQRELAELTEAMRTSGEVLHLRQLDAYTVDKHSTGGVGDKTSLLLAPILAAASQQAAERGLPRLAVPMISGRSLGHTGGTLDKLETIPGFRTDLSTDAMVRILRETHAVMVGQSPTLVPADRILYALRDHTGTVESPFLITASIMSKKLAEDLRGLVLDVKVGSGAFMPTPEASQQLARLLVDTGHRAGTRTVALLTAMDQPLGRFSGNWLEVQECVDLLQNHRHPMSADLLTLTLALAGWMLHLGGHAATPGIGSALADDLLRSGAAFQAWLRIVAAQGGDLAVFKQPATHHHPKASRVLRAQQNGFLHSMDCKAIGWAIQWLGAGRTRPGDPVSAHAGLQVHAKLGDQVMSGQPLFTLFTEDAALLPEAERLITAALHVSERPPVLAPLVREVIQA